MSGAIVIERAALDQLAALLLERAGLKITPDGYAGLRLALHARMPVLGLSDASDYVGRLRQLSGEEELRALMPLVTVGKTEFFRDARQFLAFEREVFPRLLAEARAAQRPVRLWSAGCATGEEPYSLAMAALERGGTRETVSILATDLNPAAVESASAGLYQPRRLVGLSEERLERFFTREDGAYRVIDAVRALVRFEGHNLAAPAWPQVSARSLDVIFCRNVIIYFDPPTILGVLERFYETLRPGGWLFLGYSESLFKFSTRFEMVEVGGTFAYQRPLPAARAPSPAPRPSTPAPPPVPRSPTDVESVLRELKRAARLPPPAPSPPGVPVPPAPPETPVQRLAHVVEAIEAGDFPRALRVIRRLVDDEPEDLSARLTLGNVYALMGNVEEARETFQQALAREPLCVEARLYLALAEMQAGAFDEARQELTRALFLEPTLAVGHYLLGQVQERRGDAESARRAYRNAIAQRRHETHELIGHFPDLPRSNEAIAQAAQFRLAALSER